MTDRHEITAAAAAQWTATVTLTDGELTHDRLTPAASPDGPDYYYCSCGEEFPTQTKAIGHLKGNPQRQ